MSGWRLDRKVVVTRGKGVGLSPPREGKGRRKTAFRPAAVGRKKKKIPRVIDLGEKEGTELRQGRRTNFFVSLNEKEKGGKGERLDSRRSPIKKGPGGHEPSEKGKIAIKSRENRRFSYPFSGREKRFTEQGVQPIRGEASPFDIRGRKMAKKHW